jgi:hypothetical protein
VRREFALARQDLLADHLDALRLDLGFEQRLDFLDDDAMFDRRHEGANLFERHRGRTDRASAPVHPGRLP